VVHAETNNRTQITPIRMTGFHDIPEGFQECHIPVSCWRAPSPSLLFDRPPHLSLHAPCSEAYTLTVCIQVDTLNSLDRALPRPSVCSAKSLPEGLAGESWKSRAIPHSGGIV
jgi:hypothetical protein